MRTFRRPTINEYTGFDRHGVVVGTAHYSINIGRLGGWKVSIVGEEPTEVKHESEATRALIDAGAVNLKSSDGVKR